MKRKLTADECFARAEAFEECAEHLTMAWTDDPLERKAGEIIEKSLRVRVEKWRAMGRKRSVHNAIELTGSPQAASPATGGSDVE